MSERETQDRRWWSVVLSGGEGRRVRPLARRLFGEERPKQYCSFLGTRTLLQHTVDRATSIVPPDRILTVIGNGHAVYLSSVSRELPGRVIEEPASRGTAPGIFLPATYVLAQDPEATLLILPSDHFVLPEKCFLDQLGFAGALADSLKTRLVILAALPTRPESEFGWVEAGPALEEGSGFGARSVTRFYEKPSSAEAERFLRRGFLWNTMVMAVKVRTLWALGQALFPGMMKRFESLLDILRLMKSGKANPELENLALRDVYRGLQNVNFSRRVLQQAPEWIAVLPMVDVAWNDWGHPARIASDLETLSPSGRLRLA